MIIEQSQHIIDEISKVFIGKDEIIKKVLMTIYAGGHILLNDTPGTGKTTLALAFSKALGLDYKRIQFTTDTLPSDIVGFTMLNNETQKFEFRPGAVFSNLLLADEINRTSPKTQAALLEAMEEHNVTVDGVTYDLPHPFISIATQNPIGSAGTQPLPESQLDRFMVCLSIGYPDLDKQIEIIKSRRYDNPIDKIKVVASKENVIEVQNYLSSVRISDDVLKYVVLLCEKTREMPLIELGVSPRGVLALVQMAKAHAVLEDRIYVIPEDGQDVIHYLFINGQYEIANRTRIFSDRGTVAFITELSNSLTKLMQFTKGAYKDAQLEKIYFAGLETYEEDMLMSTISSNLSIETSRFKPTNYTCSKDNNFPIHKYLFVGSLWRR